MPLPYSEIVMEHFRHPQERGQASRTPTPERWRGARPVATWWPST